MPAGEQINIDLSRKMLTRTLAAKMKDPGDYPTVVNDVTLFRRDVTNRNENCLYSPLIVIIAQGTKRTQVGTEIYDYHQGDVMVMGVDLPATSVITEASPESPYLSMAVALDSTMIARLSMEMPPSNFESPPASSGLIVQQADAELVDAFLRLCVLLDRPERVPVLAPMIIREIHYLLLLGPNGHSLRSFHTSGYRCNQIARAVSWLKDNLSKAVQIEEIANELDMSPSTFHRHFKAVTNMSPLQYQKKLRLHEAQRLMLAGDLDAGKACSAVGYESLSQFSREYKRLFGDPPRRNVVKLRELS